MPNTSHRGRGLTLIEVLIAIVIVTVVTAIAIPAVRSHGVHARRAEAIDALIRIQTAEERFFAEYNRYSAELAAAPPQGLGVATSAGTRYGLRVDLTRSGSVGFTAHARLRQPLRDPDPACAEFSVNQNGVRAAVDAAGVDHTDECWRGAAR